jgi:hypothetical protein
MMARPWARAGSRQDGGVALGLTHLVAPSIEWFIQQER